MGIKKIIIGVLILLSVGMIGGWYLRGGRQEQAVPQPSQGTSTHEVPSQVASTTPNLIRVSAPQPNEIVKSPLTVEGEARGMWYFEASFPVKIVDANGKLLGSTPAQAQGEWMTKQFVPFKAELNFIPSMTETGELVLEKDNPSGLPENADEIRLPIRFDLSNIKRQAVKLYYYHSSKDTDAEGNVLCSKQGLEAVERMIPVTKTPIGDTIRRLFEGGLMDEERTKGISTEYPLPGVALKNASLRNGILTLTINDPEHKTSGGSCRVSVLRAQIEATAKQFPGVTEVRFLPADVFQP